MQHQVGSDRLPLLHLIEKERGTCVAALIAQITLPIRLHLAGVSRTGLTTNCDPIDPAPKPRSQIKWPKQWRNG